MKALENRFARFAFLLSAIFLFLTQAAVGDEFSRDGTLVILVSSDKPIYKFGEPIRLTLRLRNNTTAPLIVNRRLDPFNDLRWELFKEPDGFMSVRIIPSKPITSEDFIELKPEQEIVKNLPPLSEITPDPLKRGLYGVRLTYTNREKPEGLQGDIWTGEIVTNRLSIQIRSGEKA